MSEKNWHNNLTQVCELKNMFHRIISNFSQAIYVAMKRTLKMIVYLLKDYSLLQNKV